MTNAIQTENLQRNFGKVRALDRVSLCVGQGTVHALVGPNGAGKTTLIKILMNILRASGGEASVLGIESRKLSGKAFGSIGYVSENQQLPGWMKVGTFLAYLRPFYPTWDQALERQLVTQFDLPVDRKLNKLSRGMQMKAALASALAFRPRLIVLDEPFSGLDPLVRDELCNALAERAAGCTIFVSSHDLAEVGDIATHLAYLERGRLRVCEEMSALAGRFREVEVRPASPTLSLANLPTNWTAASANGGTITLVDTAFNEERARAEIARRFGSECTAEFRPMSLKEIFLTLAKSGTRPSDERTDA